MAKLPCLYAFLSQSQKQLGAEEVRATSPFSQPFRHRDTGFRDKMAAMDGKFKAWMAKYDKDYSSPDTMSQETAFKVWLENKRGRRVERGESEQPRVQVPLLQADGQL